MTQRSAKWVEQWAVAGAITRVWGWLAAALALGLLGAGLGGLLIPAALLWLVFGGG